MVGSLCTLTSRERDVVWKNRDVLLSSDQKQRLCKLLFVAWIKKRLKLPGCLL